VASTLACTREARSRHLAACRCIRDTGDAAGSGGGAESHEQATAAPTPNEGDGAPDEGRAVHSRPCDWVTLYHDMREAWLSHCHSHCFRPSDPPSWYKRNDSDEFAVPCPPAHTETCLLARRELTAIDEGRAVPTVRDTVARFSRLLGLDKRDGVDSRCATTHAHARTHAHTHTHNTATTTTTTTTTAAAATTTSTSSTKQAHTHIVHTLVGTSLRATAAQRGPFLLSKISLLYNTALPITRPELHPYFLPRSNDVSRWAAMGQSEGSSGLLERIFFALRSPRDIAKAALVCRRWRDVATSQAVWRVLLEQVFGESDASAVAGAGAGVGVGAAGEYARVRFRMLLQTRARCVRGDAAGSHLAFRLVKSGGVPRAECVSISQRSDNRAILCTATAPSAGSIAEGRNEPRGAGSGVGFTVVCGTVVSTTPGDASAEMWGSAASSGPASSQSTIREHQMAKQQGQDDLIQVWDLNESARAGSGSVDRTPAVESLLPSSAVEDTPPTYAFYASGCDSVRALCVCDSSEGNTSFTCPPPPHTHTRAPSPHLHSPPLLLRSLSS
jgi:hypothetical protein